MAVAADKRGGVVDAGFHHCRRDCGDVAVWKPVPSGADVGVVGGEPVSAKPVYCCARSKRLLILPGRCNSGTDSGIVLCKSNATSITGLTAKTQATATSSSNVDVYVIPGASTRFVIGVTNGGSDTKAGEVLIGSNEGLAVNSCVCTLSTGNDSNEILRVQDVLGRVEPQGNDTNNVPGFAIVSVVQSALDAEGAGL